MYAAQIIMMYTPPLYMVTYEAIGRVEYHSNKSLYSITLL